MQQATLTVDEVVDYFLAKCDKDAGDLISNLKLQKLLYFAQGFSMAINDHPLFEDDFEAWTHGPVVPNVYHKYKQYGGNALPLPDSFDISKYSTEDIDLMDQVYDQYGRYSAWMLRDLSHERGAPWDKYFCPQANVIIPKEAMKDFFKQRVSN